MNNSSNELTLPTVHRKSHPITVSALPDSGFPIPKVRFFPSRHSLLTLMKFKNGFELLNYN
jgi:hypothetical protein